MKGSLDFMLLRKTTFLLYCICGTLEKFMLNSYGQHVVNFALAAGVQPRHLAVWAVSTLSCTTTSCRICVSLIADRKCVNRLVIYACGLSFASLSFIPPVAISGVIGTYLSVVFYGLNAGLFASICRLMLTC